MDGQRGVEMNGQRGVVVVTKQVQGKKQNLRIYTTMKFGEHILKAIELSEPEWAPFFLNYALLKSFCKHLTPRESDQDAAEGDAEEEMFASEKKVLASDKQEMLFFKTLHSELKKASELFRIVELQLSVRCSRLLKMFSILQNHERLNQAKEKANEGMNYRAKLMEACVNFYKEILLLEDFAVVNYTAVSKCLKKHDRWSGFRTREKFMANVLSKEPIAQCLYLHDMLHEVDDLFAQLEEEEVEQQFESTCRYSPPIARAMSNMDEDMKVCIGAILDLKRESRTMRQEAQVEEESDSGVPRSERMEADGDVALSEEERALNLADSQSTIAGTGVGILQVRNLSASSRVPLCSMCETMDLVATTSEGPKGQTVVRRFLDWQKVQILSQMEGGEVTALSWSPDGSNVALGTREGDIQVVSVESGKQLGWEKLVGSHEIACMKWSSQSQKEVNAPDVWLSAGSRAIYDPSLSSSNMRGGWQRLLGESQCNSNCSSTVNNNETKDVSMESFESMRKGPLTLLACADKKGSIRFYAFGLFCLFSTQLPRGFPVALELSPDLSALGAISGGPGEPITLSITRIPELWTARHRLVTISSCRTSLGLLTKDMHLSLLTISSSWLEATSPLGTKLLLLSKMLQDYGIYDSCPRDEFTNLVTCGYASPPLHQFLLQSFTKGHISRLKKTVDHAARCAEAETRDGLGGYARRTLAVIGELNGLALMPGAEKWFVEEGSCVNLVQLAQIVCYGVEGLLREVQMFRSRLCLFLDYLQQWQGAVVEGDATADSAKSTGSDKASPSLGIMRNVLSYLMQPSILTLKERQQHMQPMASNGGGGDGGGSSCADTPAFQAEDLMWCRMGYYLGKTASHYPAVAKSSCINGSNTGGSCTTIDTDPFSGIIPAAAINPPPITESLEALEKEVEAVCAHPTLHLTELAQRAPWAYYAVGGEDHANMATALQFTKPVERNIEEGSTSAQLESTTEMWMLVTAVSEGSIVWVFEVDIDSGGIRAAALNICCGTPISVPRICVKQIRFYSPLYNTPPFRDHVEERLVLLLHGPDEGTMWISSIVITSLDFKAIKYDSKSGLISSARESGVLSVTVDILQTGNEFACRSKQLVGPNPATMLEVSAGRGMTCVWGGGGGGGYFYVLDMEGDGEDDLKDGNGKSEDEEEEGSVLDM